MFSNNNRKALVTALAGAALASAVGASGAAADQYMDLRSPDAIEAARDAAPSVPQSGPYPVAESYVDLRMPDSVEAPREAGDPSPVAPPPSSIAQSAGKAYEDLRMPDSRDQPKGSIPAPDTQPVADEPSTPGAFDWLSAALGAAAGAAIVLVLFAAGGIRRLSGPARA